MTVESASNANRLRVDFLFLDLEPCTRCRGTDRNLESALDSARELLAASGTEACTDGSGDSIACRIWVHRGEEHTEPPVAMIADAILREVSVGAREQRETESEPYELPENLERFFAGKTAAQAAGGTAAEPAQTPCCPSSEQRTCCDSEDKAECCGPSSEGGCGCR